MKIFSKIVYVLWSLVVLAVLFCYCVTAIVGSQVKDMVVSSVESMGTDYLKYEDKIDESNYTRLWHERADMVSYDRIQIQEQNLTQEYTVSTPQILFFSSKEKVFSFNKTVR